MEKEYDIDERLYKSLCSAVEKWFEQNKAYVGKHKGEYANGMSLSSDEIIMRGQKYEAAFSVNMCTDTELERKRFSFIVSLMFRDVIDLFDFKAKSDILDVINWYNHKCDDRCITYSLSSIYVTQHLYFYKGFVLEEDEVLRILDEFFFDEYIEELTEVIASGDYRIPDPKPIKQI